MERLDAITSREAKKEYYRNDVIKQWVNLWFNAVEIGAGIAGGVFVHDNGVAYLSGALTLDGIYSGKKNFHQLREMKKEFNENPSEYMQKRHGRTISDE